MSLTPTQLQELQTITLDLGEEFPHNADALWNAAIRIQKAGLGPVTGAGQAAFDAAVADIKQCQDDVQPYQSKQGSFSSGFDVAVLQALPIGAQFPVGNVGDIMYLETAPNTYVAVDQIVIDPVGPNSVQMDEVGTTVFRTVPPASGGIEINNLSTGAGFERVLTTADLGGGAVPGGANTNVQYNDGGVFGGDANFVWDDVAKTLTLSMLGGSGAALVINNTLSNTPIIQTGGSGGSTSNIPLKMFDNSGTQFFQWFFDTSLSVGNHKLELQSSSGGTVPFIEFDNSGEMSFFGAQGSNALLFTGLTGTKKMKASVPLYFEKLAAAGADDVNEGQFWVRDTLDNEPMFTDGLGVDYVLNAAGGGGGAAGTIIYAFDTAIGGDPGAGEFRMSTANPANIASMTFSDTDVDALDIQNILGTMTVGCHIIMRNTADNSQYRVYVVSAITDNVGWWQFNVDQADGNGDATIGAAGTEIEFEFFTSGWVQPGVSLGGNNDELAYWNPSTGHWEGSGTLINVNVASPPLGGRLFLGTTSGYSTTSPQILRGLGAADTVMDYVFGTDANNGFLQGYRRVAGEMSFGARIASVDTDLLTFDLSANVRIQTAAAFRIGEKGAAAADLATYGQLWVDSADDSLNYQTEAGVNTVLGGGFDPTLDQVISGSWEFTNALGVEFGPSCELRLRNNADSANAFIQNLGPTLQFGIAGADFGSGIFEIGSSWLKVQINRSIFFDEKAAQGTPVVGDGEFWVRSDSPNVPMFTDDDGTDFVLNAAAAPVPPIVLLDSEQIQFGTGTDVTMDWNGTEFDIAFAASASLVRLRDGAQLRFMSPNDVDSTFIQQLADRTNILSSGPGAGFWQFSPELRIINDLTFGSAGVILITESGGDMRIDLGTLGDLRIRGGNTGVEIMAEFTANAGVALYHDNARRFETVGIQQDGVLSGAILDDADGNMLHIGFQEQIWILEDGNLGTTNEVWRDAAGHILYSSDAGTETYTIPAAADGMCPDGYWTDIVNLGTGAITVAEGVGVTLTHLDGGGATGSLVIAQFGKMRLHRRIGAAWYASNTVGVT